MRSALAVVIALFVGLSATSIANGSDLDATFGNRGTAIYEHGGTLQSWVPLDERVGQAKALAIDGEGRILVGGGSGAAMLILRYLPDGSLDPSFGDGGVLRFFEYRTTGSGSEDADRFAPRIKTILPKADGGLVAIGNMNAFGSSSPVGFDVTYWITENGELDTTVGLPFSEAVGELPYSSPRSAVTDSDGNILIAGSSVVQRDDFVGFAKRYAGYVMKRNSVGQPIDGFGGNYAPGGGSPWPGIRALVPKGSPPYSAYSDLQLLRSGKILTGGHHNNRLFVSRLKANGKPDKTFGPWRGKRRSRNTGMTIANFGGKKCRCANNGAIVTDRKGRIYQVGTSSYPYKDKIATIVVVRYLPNGALDKSFGRNGYASIIRKPWAWSTDIALQRNGRVVVTGRYMSASNPKAIIARFTNRGHLDKSFFDDGVLTQDLGGSSTAEKVLVDNRGRLVVAGGVTNSDTGGFLLERIVP